VLVAIAPSVFVTRKATPQNRSCNILVEVLPLGRLDAEHFCGRVLIIGGEYSDRNRVSVARKIWKFSGRFAGGSSEQSMHGAPLLQPVPGNYARRIFAAQATRAARLHCARIGAEARKKKILVSRFAQVIRFPRTLQLAAVKVHAMLSVGNENPGERRLPALPRSAAADENELDPPSF